MHGMSIVSANSDGTAGNGACYQWRPTAGGTSSSVNYGGTPAAAAPYWTKIERIGNQFSAYLSADGKTWTQTGTAQTIAMQDPVLIGLCVTSHVAGTLRTYTFDNVSYTGNVTPRPPQAKATNPNPANGAVGVATPLMQWSPGETAVFHNVYFGTTPELTEADLKAPKQTYAMYFYPFEFTPGKTYYWRVDEIDAAMAVHKGDTWSLTAATLAAYNPLPPDGAKYQPIDVDLSWSPGQNAVSHEVYFSTDKNAVANADAGVFKGKQPTYDVRAGRPGHEHDLLLADRRDRHRRPEARRTGVELHDHDSRARRRQAGVVEQHHRLDRGHAHRGREDSREPRTRRRDAELRIPGGYRRQLRRQALRLAARPGHGRLHVLDRQR